MKHRTDSRPMVRLVREIATAAIVAVDPVNAREYVASGAYEYADDGLARPAGSSRTPDQAT